ncbi:MAG: response regulator [Polyangiaceae bacterium]|nr:response regulator [Polyangiaceae bacterium]
MSPLLAQASLVLTIALAGVVAFLAAEQLWLWRTRRQESLHLWAALVSLDALAYLFARALQSVSVAPDSALFALHVMHTATLLLVPLGLGAIRAGVGHPRPRAVVAFFAVAGAMLVLLWLTPAVLGGHVQPRTNLLGQSYWAATTGTASPLLVAYYLVGFGYPVWMLRRAPLVAGERGTATVLVAAVGLAGLNDLLLNVGLRTFHVLEYAIAGLAISLDYILARRLRQKLASAVDAARQSEAKLRALIEGAPDPIVLHRDGRILHLNSAGLAWLGYRAPVELVGQPLERIFVDGPVAPGPSAAETEGREPRFRRQDGTLLTGEVVSLSVVLDGELATLSRVHDTTEVRRMKAHVAASDRLASIGTLAAGIAHEINNPLSYLTTNLEVADQSLQAVAGALPPPALRELGQLLAEARDGADRIRRIVGDLRTLSRSDDEAVEAVDLREVLDWSTGIAWNEIRHRARLIKDYEPGCVVEGNVGRLGQVFLNLLVNAAQAIPEGHATHNEIRVTARRSGDRVVVEVADTGSGMDAATLARLFEPFFTTKPIGVGTGLGLPICHGIVTARGGQIRVQSALGAGTTVSVELPAAAVVARAPSARPVAPVAVPRQRVLVVDDEPLVRRSLERALRGHEVSSADGGREAIALCLEGEHDVILCDLMMPDVTGMDVYEAVCAVRPELARRFVFITGGAFTPRARAFVDALPNTVVDKPISVAKLEVVIRDVVARDPRATEAAG